MNFWLLKSDPESYSWDDLVSEKTTVWDGVRNYQARNYIREMKKNDKVLFYQSSEDKFVIGIAKIISEAFQDPSSDDDKWLSVLIEPMKSLKKHVTLERIKADENLKNIALLKQSRLSVMPLTKDEFDTIVKLGK